MSAPRTGCDMDKYYEHVAEVLNNEFGEDLSSLEKTKDLLDRLNKRKEEIETKLSIASDEVPSKLSRALNEVDDIMARMEDLQNLQATFKNQVSTHLHRVEPVVKDLKQPIEEVTLIEHYIRYLHSEIQTALLVKAEPRAVLCFSNLARLSSVLSNSKCLHLVNFIEITVKFWHELLKDKFTKDFENILKLVKWPFLSAVSIETIQNPDPELIVQLETVFTSLLRIQLPDELAISSAPSGTVILPMQLLLKPLRKRFLYHFHGTKETNNLDKPEWYYTQVLTWIKDHSSFLEMTIQNIFNKAEIIGIDAKVEFMHGLVQLVIDKLSASIDTIIYDDHSLSHTINETLLFEKELRFYGYPLSYPNCLTILTSDRCFTRWINMERKSAVEKMDTIMSSDIAWKFRFQDGDDLDDLKVPECGENFMTLILTITDRYKSLPHPGHRLQFLDLQLELLDDFRLRLQQLLKEEAKEPIDSNYCAILNTCFYIIQVLTDWSELPFFLQTQYYKLQYENNQSQLQSQMSTTFPSAELLRINRNYSGELSPSQTIISNVQKEALDSLQEDFSDDKLDFMTGTVFEKIINLLEHMKIDMIRKLADYVATEVKAKSYPYRSDKWFSMPSQKEFIVPTLSSSACNMLSVLTVQLHTLKNSLSEPLFNTLWELVAVELNSYFYEELIMRNKFNDGGCAQVHFDISRNLFPIFGEYSRKPENYFKDLKEALILLILPKGSAILLQDALKTGSELTDPKKALAEIGIHKLKPTDVIQILNLRTDLFIL
uniref:RAD50-interacting protein 1 n=1 Tax=Strigamia maritima TaxID=126957 RepID=T1IUF6_STRMM